MTLEDELRQLFAARAAGVRSAPDPAGRAIRRARVLRWRRAIGSGVAGLVLLTSLGGVAAFGAHWVGNDLGPSREAAGGPAGPPVADPAAPASVTPAPRPTASRVAQKINSMAPGDQLRLLGTDMRVDDELWSTSGHRFPLAGVGRVTRVYRVPLGWVYGGADKVNLLRTDGSRVMLGALGTDWLVSPAGDRLAYTRGPMLMVAEIGKRGLEAGVSAKVPDRTRPVAFAGDQAVVAIGDDGPYGVLPVAESDAPVWSGSLVTVYGAAGDTIIGLVRDAGRDGTCLATLASGGKGLVVLRSGACRAAPADPTTSAASGPDAATGEQNRAGGGGDVAATDRDGGTAGAAPPAVLAPDGAWLAEPAGDGLVLTQVAAALAGKGASVPCPAGGAVAPVWTDDTTLLVSDGERATHCRTTGDSRTVPLPDGITGRDWAFVPNLVPTADR